jgi:4-alpha-glucanotransferase
VSTTPSRPARSAGVLLHPTSLPGPYGIGDLGPIAHEWVDVLASARQRWWQVLPLGPTGYGDSPYQCFSAFAGNIYLLSPELLRRDGLIGPLDVVTPSFPTGEVDYGAVVEFKQALLARAWGNYRAGAAPSLRAPFDEFCGREARWLNDYALYAALKEKHDGASWLEWEPDLRLRKPAALDRAHRVLVDDAGRHCFGQFLFWRQWSDLKAYAHTKGIRLIGDVPIFVATDSADVWANPEQFKLDEDRQPTVVAGVPPDYFSATGQLWGNPHYDWEKMKASGYTWWIARFRKTLEQVDLVRLDHFRGFEASWEVPAGSPTAETGEWVPGPGADLLTAVQKALGRLPLIAEDLGVITPGVEALRDAFDLPGMRILQFAFDGSENRFLPHNFEHNTFVYTGTHDNDTTHGWYSTLPEHVRDFFQRYYPWRDDDVAWGLMRLAWSSVADFALVPLQDILSLPTESRMNYPGRPSGNWRWRFHTGQLTPAHAEKLADWTSMYGRANGQNG